MLQDFRYALRSLQKSPGFVLVATLCLGLALALNTTTFAILDAMLHPSLPVRDPDRLFHVSLWGRQAANDAPVWERYQVLRSGTFYEEIAFLDWESGATIRAGDEVRDEPVYRVSANFYSLLGVRPQLGRLLGPGGPEDGAVVSHGFWDRALGGRPLDGLTIWINEREYRIVGVLPSTMTFPGSGVAVALPPAAEESGVGVRNVAPLVKVRPGWTREAVAAQLATLARRLTLEYGSGGSYSFVPHAVAPRPHELRQIHFAMAGAAFLVLLIACANLASLMLVRGAGQRREIALRMALGAGRPTVVRHLLSEAAVIAALGMAVGLLLTLWAIPVLGNQMPPSVDTLGVVKPLPSWRVFTVGVLAGLATIAVFGLWPALRASDVEVSEPLKDSAWATTGKQRWRYSPVVVAEVALTLVLLMGVALLTKAADRLSESMLGFDRQGLLDARVWLGGVVGSDSAQRISRDLLARVGALPRVQSVAAVGDRRLRIVRSEFYDGFNGMLNRAWVFHVSDGFLRTLGVPVLQGRDFLPGDEQSGAVIVDEAAASALWPDGRPVGRLINVGGSERNGTWVRVVGVARRAWVRGPPIDPYLAPEGVVYEAWQPHDRTSGWQLAVRTARLDGQAAVALRQAIRDALPGDRALRIEPWLSGFDASLNARFFLISVFAAFSAFALALAAIGLFGVIAYSVSQRMREFAVRIAVGAPARVLVKLVAHDGAVMVLAGTGIGAFLAMGSSTLLGDWLYDIYHTDAVALVVAEAVLLLAGFAACLQPALRAMRADPMEILRAT